MLNQERINLALVHLHYAVLLPASSTEANKAIRLACDTLQAIKLDEPIRVDLSKPIRVAGSSSVDKPSVKAFYLSGQTVKACANEFGIAQTCIRYILAKQGVTVRGPQGIRKSSTMPKWS